MAAGENNDNDEFNGGTVNTNLNFQNNNNYNIANFNNHSFHQVDNKSTTTNHRDGPENKSQLDFSGMAQQHQQQSQDNLPPTTTTTPTSNKINKPTTTTNNIQSNDDKEKDNNSSTRSDPQISSSSSSASSTSSDDNIQHSCQISNQRMTLDHQQATSITNVQQATTITTNRDEQPTQQVPSKQLQAANNRSILILREIEPKTSESSVKNIFNSENCPSKPVHCEYALHNSWYVTFKNDEEAKQAINYIRKYIVKWNGQPIMARYKPKPAALSTNNVPSNVLPQMVIQQQQRQLDTNVNVSSPSSISNTATVNIISPSSGIMAGAGTGTPSILNPAGAISPPTATNPSPSLLVYHQPQNHSMLHHQQLSNHAIHQPSGLQNQHHHQHHHHTQQHHNLHHYAIHQHHHHQQQPVVGPQQQYGFSAVAYYGQNGPVMTPYQNPQYDLSEVFIYNGLTPYPALAKSPSSGQKVILNGGGGITKAALLGRVSS